MRPALRGHKGAQGGPDISADADTDLSLKHAMLVPQFRTLLFSVFSFGWASYGVRVSLIPLLVAVTFGGDATMAAWILAAYAAGNAVFIFPAGRWTDTIGRKPMLVVGLSILAVAYAAMGIAPSMWVLGAIMLAAGTGSALANPGQQAVLADVLAKRRGGGPVAAYSMASDLGGVLGPALAGLVVDLAGFSWAFVLTAVLLAAAASVWSLSRDSRSLG